MATGEHKKHLYTSQQALLTAKIPAKMFNVIRLTFGIEK